ncbi:unnamed protein product [Ixodes hexagonus]
MNGCGDSVNERNTERDILTLLEKNERNCGEISATILEETSEAQRREKEKYVKLCHEYDDMKSQLNQLREKSRVEAATQDARRKDIDDLSRKIELLKVQDRDALERVKASSDEFDENLASDTEKLLSLATDIEMQWCNATQHLEGVAHKYSTASTPLLQPTSGLNRCEVADRLWNLVSAPLKDL